MDTYFEQVTDEEKAALQSGALSWPDRKMQRWGGCHWREAGAFDWTGCDDVEVVVGRLSGVPTLLNSRFSADNLLQLHEDGLTAEEIVADYELELTMVRRVLEFANSKKRQLAAA